MFRRRMARRAVRRRTGRPLLRAAAVGGAGYYAGKKVAEGRGAEAMQDQQIADLQDEMAVQQAPAAYAPPPAAPPPPAPAAPPPAAAASTSADRIAQLKELGELRASGVLTEEEFEREKQRILGGG